MDLRIVTLAGFAALALVTLAAACRDPAPQGSTATPPSAGSDDRVFAGGIAPAAEPMARPAAPDARSAAEGEKLFTSMNCDGCHGGGAVGAVGPSLSARRWRYGGRDAAVFQSIYYGRPHGMPAFGGVLPPPMIWKLVAYIRSLPRPQSVPTESW